MPEEGEDFVAAAERVAATDGDQIGPSVAPLPNGFAVAWTDTSHVAPDTQGSAVRARIFYPPN